jgi:hypothetical protein
MDLSERESQPRLKSTGSASYFSIPSRTFEAEDFPQIALEFVFFLFETLQENLDKIM